MSITYVNTIKHLFVFIFLLFCFVSCKPEPPQWDNATIDSNISRDSIYTKLDQQKDILSFGDENDSLMKRTSDVAYFSGEKINLADDKYAKLNNCRAYFNHSDTLIINIGIGNGFGGQGFMIRYKNKKFYAMPYLFSDTHFDGEPETTYKIIYQKLTLDKSIYVIGDSLYGNIEFKSIETNAMKLEHYGKGSFRAKVKEVSY